MSEAKFTPGPWEVNEHEHCGARIDGPNGRSVAHAIQRDPHPTLGQGITQVEAAANARLIASAPDLYAALQGLMDLESRGRLMPIGREWDAARAALRRAQGETAA